MAIERLFRLVYLRAPSANEIRACLDHWQQTLPLVRTPPDNTRPPLAVHREAIEENTGEKFSFSETLHANADFVSDLQPADVDARTRAFADLCLALLNSSEFVYVY
jgi:hypothetical protein